MRKIRILGIAPYDGLAIQLRQEASLRDDIEIDVFVGDLEEGVSIAKRRFSDGYDIIISRGGTAELIDNNGFPVIDIKISLYDILRSLRLADDAKKKYAIIGFPPITKNAVFLKEVLAYGMDVEVITINSLEESDNVLKRLKREGVVNIVCDTTGARSAMANKLNYILINSGTESISAALGLAVKMASEQITFKETLSVMTDIINQSPCPVLIYSNGKLIFGEKSAEDMPEGFLKSLKANSDADVTTRKSCFEYDDYGSLFSASGTKFSLNEKNITAYYVKKTCFPFSLEENGITVRNARRTAFEYEKSFFAVTNTAAKEIEILDQFILRDYPVFLVGEPGTGKSPLSQYLYISSRHSSDSLYDIDCGIAGKKAPAFIRDLYLRSPETHFVFNFKNIDKLDASTVDELIEINEEYKLGTRSYIIASATVTDGKALAEPCMRFLNRLQCLTLKLSPLREHLDDIASIASLYINFLNRTQGSTVLTIEDEAIDVMKSYDWPFNNDQLARILKKLSIEPKRMVITAEDIKSAIADENALFNESQSHFSYNFDNKTLKDIEKDVINAVLKEEHGSKSIAAKRLGISRSTLWRMLQEM